MDKEKIGIIIGKIRTEIKIPIIFAIIGFIFAILRFDFNTKSNTSLFVAMATILAALVGFIGIFVVFKLQNIHDMKSYYIKRIDILKDQWKVYYIPIFPEKDEIAKYEKTIKENLVKLNRDIENGPNHGKDITKHLMDEKLNLEIEFLSNLVQNKIKEIDAFKDYKNSFLFAIFCIFIFTIPISFGNIYILNNNIIYEKFTFFFVNWRFFEIPFTGILFGFYFIVLKDLMNILTKFFP